MSECLDHKCNVLQRRCLYSRCVFTTGRLILKYFRAHRLTVGMMYLGSLISFSKSFKDSVMDGFTVFARAHFMDVKAMKANLQSLSPLMDWNPVESGRQKQQIFLLL